MRVPKLRRVGSCTSGPPVSVHVRRKRWAASSIFQEIITRPSGTDNAPNLVVLVHSSLNVIASAMTAPEAIAMSGPSKENRPSPLLS